MESLSNLTKAALVAFIWLVTSLRQGRGAPVSDAPESDGLEGDGERWLSSCGGSKRVVAHFAIDITFDNLQSKVNSFNQRLEDIVVLHNKIYIDVIPMVKKLKKLYVSSIVFCHVHNWHLFYIITWFLHDWTEGYTCLCRYFCTAYVNVEC